MRKLTLLLAVTATILVFAACTPNHTHKISSVPIVVREATCAEDGLSHIICTECGEVVNTFIIPKTNKHTEIIDPAVDSTCTETGYTEGKHCADCGKIIIKQSETPLKAHSEETIPAVAATCTKNGLSEGTKCASCGIILAAQKETPTIAHTYDNKYDEDCNVCGFVRDAECAHRDLITLSGYGATCTSTGLTEGSKCKKCGEILVSQEIISMQPHTEVIDAAVEETCTTPGFTQGKHCAVCQAIIVSRVPISPTGHTFSDWTTIKRATEYEEGIEERVCACGEKETQAIARLIPSTGLKFQIDGTKCFVVGLGDCTDANIVIPSTYSGLSVTHIGNEALSNCTSIKSIVIPDTVTSIGAGAFSHCTSLESITISGSVSNIDWHAFTGCTSLTSIEVDARNNNYASIDGNLYTKDGTILLQYAIGKKDTTFVVPNTVKRIGDFDLGLYTFGYCTSLINVVIPESVTHIGPYAFAYCTALESIDIPLSVTNIEEGAFYGCSSLANVNFNRDIQLRSIGANAFFECIALKKFSIPYSVNYIGEAAFAYCNALTKVIFENTNGWSTVVHLDTPLTSNMSSAELSNPSTASFYLVSTLWQCEWVRE